MKVLPILATVTVLMPAQVHAAETAPPAAEPPRTSPAQLMEGPIDTQSRPLLLPDSPLPEGGLLITAEAEATGGSSAAQVHDCGGRVVEVAADFAVVTLTGDCPHLRVRGHHNVVQVQTVRAIDVIGDRNAVTWGGVPHDASRRLKPSVSERGTGNLVGPGTVVLPAPAASP